MGEIMEDENDLMSIFDSGMQLNYDGFNQDEEEEVEDEQEEIKNNTF